MACEVRNKEINSQCAELLVRPLYLFSLKFFVDLFFSFFWLNSFFSSYAWKSSRIYNFLTLLTSTTCFLDLTPAFLTF